MIGNKKFELYPSGNVKIQQHVQETMELLLTENLVPYEELQRLLTDKNYCYETFGINWNGFRYTLLKKDRNSDTVRYWAKKYGGYYICSQLYQNCSSKFAQWLIKLSKMENKKNSKVVQKVHIIKKGSDEWKNSILRKNEIDNT